MAARNIVLWEVDVQADFMLPGGKLYVPGAEKIIPQIRSLVEAARSSGAFIVSSGDAHTPDDPEFQTFPEHCVRGTPGARILAEGLAQNAATIPNDPRASALPPLDHVPQVIFEKQTLDVFDNPRAGLLVSRLGKDAEYFVFGVVTEFCVIRAARGLLRRGRKVSIIRDAIEQINAEESRRALDELKSLGAEFLSTREAVEAMEQSAQGGAS
ncbi:MAG: cysteine hydrolase family protein [Candidatus Acidiferrales bacterium]